MDLLEVRMKWLAAVGLAFAAAAWIAVPVAGQDFAQQVDRIFDGIEASKGKTLFHAIRDLKELGRSAVEDVRRGLRRADPNVRIATAAYLYSNDFRDEAVDVLLLVATQSRDAESRQTAAGMLGVLVKEDASIPARRKKEISDNVAKAARESNDLPTRVHLWLSVWTLSGNPDAKRNLIDLFRKAEDKDLRDDAALALAEMDGLLVPGVKDQLRTLATEPSPKGKLAKAYLDTDRLLEEAQRKLERTTPATGPKSGNYDFSILTEVLDTFKQNYHDPKKIESETRRLIEQAARGIAGSLDPFSAYYDRDAIKAMREDLGSAYGGIGARVSMRKDRSGVAWLTIEEPIFSGPAYAAGLRSNDKIVEVEGESTANKELTDLVRKLRGQPGTKVKIKVVSVRWEKPRDFEIVRGQVTLESVQHTLLPGGIGYIKQTTFGQDEDERIAAAIRSMIDQGAKALVFDLRGNSGGYLDTSVRIANLFLEPNKIVVRIDAQNPNTDKTTHRTTRKPVTNLPLAVLVDGGSASASEIVAGALRDHKRAILIGEKTFGKGSVQRLYYLDATGRETAVRVTIARWFLPNGETIEKDPQDKSGILPNVEVHPPAPDLFKEREWERLRANPALEKYIERIYPQNKELLRRLAVYDEHDPSKYPGFEEFYQSTGTRATREEVRELVRDYVRRRVQDDLKKEFACDFQTDAVLQAAIREVAKTARIDVERIDEYKPFAKIKGAVEEH